MAIFQSEGYAQVIGGKIWYGISGNIRNSGVPLVVVHGGPGMSHDYLTPLAKLAKNRAVIFYDQLDAGKSDRPNEPKNWNISRFLDEITSLTSLLNIKKFNLFGNSWGGTLSAAYAARKPANLNRLILSSPLICTSTWIKDSHLLRARLPSKTLRVLEICENSGNTDSQEYLDAVDIFYKMHLCRIDPWPEPVLKTMNLINSVCYEGMWGPNEFTCNGILENYDGSKDLSKIDAPTLVTCGDFDEATPTSTQYFSNMIPNSNFRSFKASSHMAFIEEEADYLHLVENFLA
tara:strand:+ start:2936 stop:3805 length:870 start_codon:yes stop_codon:yes gene_type:complete